MVINIDQVLQDLEGNEMKFNGRKATVGDVATFSLLNGGSENYLEKVDLAKKIKDTEGEITLKSEEITVIKKAVQGMQFTALLVYQFDKLIDPEDGEEEGKTKAKSKK